MINSGQNIDSNETGGWTSFNQDDPCSGGTNAQEVKSLVCGDGNPNPIHLGRSIWPQTAARYKVLSANS